jgi:hypothetical protein
MNATASLLTDAYTGPEFVHPMSEAPAFVIEQDVPREERVVGGNCFRGMLFALGMEAVAGLSLYFIWQIGHIIR